MPAAPQRTRAVLAAQKLSLTQQERRELAGMLVDHHGTWANLSEDDARRIADALQAFLVVQALLLLRHSTRAPKRAVQ